MEYLRGWASPSQLKVWVECKMIASFPQTTLNSQDIWDSHTGPPYPSPADKTFIPSCSSLRPTLLKLVLLHPYPLLRHLLLIPQRPLAIRLPAMATTPASASCHILALNIAINVAQQSFAQSLANNLFSRTWWLVGSIICNDETQLGEKYIIS